MLIHAIIALVLLISWFVSYTFHRLKILPNKGLNNTMTTTCVRFSNTSFQMNAKQYFSLLLTLGYDPVLSD